MTKLSLAALLFALLLPAATPAASAQNKPIGVDPASPFSEGFVAGNTLYVGGKQGQDANNKLPADITAQTINTLASIKKVVQTAGFQMSDIVSTTIYVTDIKDFAAMNAAYKKFFPNPRPSRTTVQISGLVNGAKIEISAIAVKH